MRRVFELDREVGLGVAVDIALDDLTDRTPEGVQLTSCAGERNGFAAAATPGGYATPAGAPSRLPPCDLTGIIINRTGNESAH
jgi:hypothetical protein